MKQELAADFGVLPNKVTVIPFGMNYTIPKSSLTPRQAKERLGLQESAKTLLFFGQIAALNKGLEYLIAAMAILVRSGVDVRLIIAGKVKQGWEDYGESIRRAIVDGGLSARVILRMQFVPDEQVEQYFRAADAVVLPYVAIFQSGVLFLAFSFGVPVIATDVGSLYEDVIADKTGLVCPPRYALELARAIERYFASNLYRKLDTRRSGIRAFAAEPALLDHGRPDHKAHLSKSPIFGVTRDGRYDEPHVADVHDSEGHHGITSLGQSTVITSMLSTFGTVSVDTHERSTRDREAAPGRQPRICMPTWRRFAKMPFQCYRYEAQDVLCELDDVDLVEMAPRAGFRVTERWLRRALWKDVSRQIAYLNPGLKPVRLTREYDVFVAVCENWWDRLYINAVQGWKENCRTSVLWLDWKLLGGHD